MKPGDPGFDDWVNSVLEYESDNSDISEPLIESDRSATDLSDTDKESDRDNAPHLYHRSRD